VRTFEIDNRQGKAKAYDVEQAILCEMINLIPSNFKQMIDSVLSLDGELCTIIIVVTFDTRHKALLAKPKLLSALLQYDEKVTRAIALQIKLDVSRGSVNEEASEKLKQLQSIQDLCRKALSEQMVSSDNPAKYNEVLKALR
jgi:hypothetical protein